MKAQQCPVALREKLNELAEIDKKILDAANHEEDSTTKREIEEMDFIREELKMGLHEWSLLSHSVSTLK